MLIFGPFPLLRNLRGSPMCSRIQLHHQMCLAIASDKIFKANCNWFLYSNIETIKIAQKISWINYVAQRILVIQHKDKYYLLEMTIELILDNFRLFITLDALVHWWIQRGAMDTHPLLVLNKSFTFVWSLVKIMVERHIFGLCALVLGLLDPPMGTCLLVLF